MRSWKNFSRPAGSRMWSSVGDVQSTENLTEKKMKNQKLDREMLFQSLKNIDFGIDSAQNLALAEICDFRVWRPKSRFRCPQQNRRKTIVSRSNSTILLKKLDQIRKFQLKHSTNLTICFLAALAVLRLSPLTAMVLKCVFRSAKLPSGVRFGWVFNGNGTGNGIICCNHDQD